jgi:hypothetical protein
MVLGVFSLAITPWAVLHHHQEVHQLTAEKNCTHKFHVKTQRETCVICAVHFEKNYTTSSVSFVVYLSSKLLTKHFPIIGSSFVKLIATSLRGPPLYC